MQVDLVEVGPVAHGGHCVARSDGRVVFVRHALPGERVRIAVTDTTHDSFWRADAVEVLEPSPDRVAPPLPGPPVPAGAAAATSSTSAWLGNDGSRSAVLAEQLHRLAGVDWDGEVEPVDPDGTEDGLHWRTRMRYQVDAEGRAGLRRHRARDRAAARRRAARSLTSTRRPSPSGPGHPTPSCGRWRGDRPTLLVDGRIGGGQRRDHRAGRRTRLAVGRGRLLAGPSRRRRHPGRGGARRSAPRAGERAFDLYCGVGLFAGALVDAGVRAWGVEWEPAGHRVRPAATCPGRKFTAGKVERALRTLPKRTDLVVLDPPRTGAGKDVVDAVVARRPARDRLRGLRSGRFGPRSATRRSGRLPTRPASGASTCSR